MTTVKASVLATWNPDLHDPLDEFVKKAHRVAKYASLFARFVFIVEYESGNVGVVRELACKGFFAEAFLWLISYDRQERTSLKTGEFRSHLERHWPAFLRLTGYERQPFKNAYTVARYWGEARCRDVLTNIHQHFGEHIRGTVNLFLRVKARRRELNTRADAEGWDRQARHDARERELYGPARRIKTGLGRLDPTVDGLNATEQAVYDRLLQPLRAAYRPEHRFKGGHFYYDCKANPREHLCAMIALSCTRGSTGKRKFQALPVQMSNVPAAVEMDNLGVAKNILRCGKVLTSADQDAIWADLLQPGRREIKDVGGKTFHGHVYTDAASCCFVKKPPGLTGRGRQKRRSGDGDGGAGGAMRRVEEEPTGSSADFGEAPGAGASTSAGAGPPAVGAPLRGRPSAQRSGKRPGGITAHAGLEGLRYVDDLTPAELQQRKFVFIDPGRRDLLYCMHEDSTPEKGQRRTMRLTCNEWAFLTRSRKFRKLRERLRTATVHDCEQRLAVGAPDGYKDCTVAAFSNYLQVFSEVEPTLTEFYGQAIFRKLRFWAHMYRQKAYAALIRRLREFADGATLVLGSSVPAVGRFHEPRPGIALVRALVKAGFEVLLINEHCTSKMCPDCEQRSVETFHRVPNPRPYRRAQQPTQLCHGLLRCTSGRCRRADGSYRLWNRDLMACLNMRLIVQSLRETGERPLRFRR